jgi:hypothetical protein
LKKFAVIVFVFVGLLACKKQYSEPVVGEIERVPPAEVHNLSASSTSTLLELQWNDPDTKDLAEIEITYNGEDHRIPKGVEYFALENQALNTYSFLVKTVDDKGNISKGLKLNNSIDYRLPYCGSFKFTQYEWLNTVGSTTVYPTTQYVGYVAVDKYSSNQVVIRYKDGSNICSCTNDSVYGGYFKPELSTAGILTYTMTQQLTLGSTLNGAFLGKDSVSFNFVINVAGGTSGQNVKGKRVQ